MKYLFLSLIFFGCCCPRDVVTKTERSEKDSTATNLVPKTVYVKGDTVKIFRDSIRVVRDSVFVPIKETLKSKDGKYSVEIDRTKSRYEAQLTIKDDSLNLMVEQTNYWKWVAERTEKEVIKRTPWYESFVNKVLIGLGLVAVIALIVLLIKLEK